jgi:hypothetical protein
MELLRCSCVETNKEGSRERMGEREREIGKRNRRGGEEEKSCSPPSYKDVVEVQGHAWMDGDEKMRRIGRVEYVYACIYVWMSGGGR